MGLKQGHGAREAKAELQLELPGQASCSSSADGFPRCSAAGIPLLGQAGEVSSEARE